MGRGSKPRPFSFGTSFARFAYAVTIPFGLRNLMQTKRAGKTLCAGAIEIWS